MRTTDEYHLAPLGRVLELSKEQVLDLAPPSRSPTNPKDKTMIPNARILALLEQLDREDTNPNPRERYLTTTEIRRILGLESGPDYARLRALIDDVNQTP